MVALHKLTCRSYWRVIRPTRGPKPRPWCCIELVMVLEIDLEKRCVRASQGGRPPRWYGEEHALTWRETRPDRLTALFKRFRTLEKAA
jgi:hypothetical protein